MIQFPNKLTDIPCCSSSAKLAGFPGRGWKHVSWVPGGGGSPLAGVSILEGRLAGVWCSL